LKTSETDLKNLFYREQEARQVLELDYKEIAFECDKHMVSYGPPWAHYLGGYQDRLLGGPLGLPGLHYTAPEGVEHKDSTGVVLGLDSVHVPHCVEVS
jgi:hypothetical protein